MGYIKPAIESECTVLGGLILDSKLFEDIKDKICPLDFFAKRHQVLFQAMSELYAKHGMFDAPMILDHVDYENSEDMERVYCLANNCCSTANIKAHADIIREKSVQRQLMECVKEAKDKERQGMNQQGLLVSYLEETAAEIKSAHIDAHYLKIVLSEVCRAFTSTIIAIEDQEEVQFKPADLP